MKVTHLCLSGMLTEGWSYQENMLIKYHVLAGHTVSVITSQWIRTENGEKKLNKSNYIGEYGARYIRLPIKNKDAIGNRLKRYTGVIEAIEHCSPDVLFIHNFQFIDIVKIAKYLKKHKKIIVYVDNHSDLSNSGTNWISLNFLHKGLWRYCAHKIEPYTKKFYGVLPVRVEFLKDIYKLPAEKCELLVMGADDELVEKAKQSGAREKIRKQYGIDNNDFLIMTGGKIDQWKTQTLLLMQAVQNIKNEHIRLIVFGSVTQELIDQVKALADGKKVQYIGWLQSKDTYEYVQAVDLFVFPGRHSVFWEQVAGQGIPMLVKDWPGTHHIDIGGNVKFLSKDCVEEIQNVIEQLWDNTERYEEMRKVAEEKGIQLFSYRNIAKRSIPYSFETDDF